MTSLSKDQLIIAKEAKVYLLDEPASGLDPLSSNELSLFLRKLSSMGAAILMMVYEAFFDKD